MITSLTTCSESTAPSATMKLVSQKFALLAKVGHQKRKHSELLGETEFYSGIVSELLVLVEDMLSVMEAMPDETMNRSAELSFRLVRKKLVNKLLTFYPKDLDLLNLRWDLLTSDGLENVLMFSQGEWPIQSPAQTLDLVGLSLGATREECQSPSPS